VRGIFQIEADIHGFDMRANDGNDSWSVSEAVRHTLVSLGLLNVYPDPIRSWWKATLAWWNSTSPKSSGAYVYRTRVGVGANLNLLLISSFSDEWRMGSWGKDSGDPMRVGVELV